MVDVLIVLQDNQILQSAREQANMNSSDHDPKHQEGDSSVSSEYRKDRGREGKFNIVIGILFLIWTAFDVFSGLYDSWHSHVPFALVGCAFLIYGVIQYRAQRAPSKRDN